MNTQPTVVLVHGAFADASGFAAVSAALTEAGIANVAAPNPLRGLGADAAAVSALVSAIAGPVILVGHSYGGAVVTQAASSLSNVTGLVYLAGFALEVGESAVSAQEAYPATALGQAIRPTAYDAPGAAGGPDVYVDQELYPEVIAADVAAPTAAFLGRSQRPIAYTALTEPATEAAWHDLPTWYLVAGDDKALSPEAQRAWAARMGAHTVEVASSHAVHLSHADATLQIIKDAVGA